MQASKQKLVKTLRKDYNELKSIVGETRRFFGNKNDHGRQEPLNKLLAIDTLLPRMIRTKSSSALRPRVGTATSEYSQTAFKNEKLKQTLKDSLKREEDSKTCCVPVVKTGSTLSHVMPTIDHLNTAVLADTLQQSIAMNIINDFNRDST